MAKRTRSGSSRTAPRWPSVRQGQVRATRYVAQDGACAAFRPALAIPIPRGPGARLGPRFVIDEGEEGRVMDLTVIAIGLGLLAIVYGFVTSRQVLGSSAGSEKMQEIAAAIQEGAQAYLDRKSTRLNSSHGY